MVNFEYKLLPAPTRGLKAKGVRSAEARFAYAVEVTINAMASDGWEYLRADTLPHEERQGLTGSATTFRTLLVFRRALPTPEDTPVPADTDALSAPFPIPAVLAPAVTEDMRDEDHDTRHVSFPPERDGAERDPADDVGIAPFDVAATLERDGSSGQRHD